MNAAGYSLLIQQLGLSAVPLRLPAIVQPVTRIECIGHTLAVPPAIAPAPDDLLGHVLFALKHEGINLAVLAQALPRIPAAAFEHLGIEDQSSINILRKPYRAKELEDAIAKAISD